MGRMASRALAVRWLYVLGSAWLAGCYLHVPVEPEAVPEGAQVRARVTGSEADRLAAVRGGDDRTVDGRLIQVDEGGSLVLEVAQRGASPGARPMNARVVVPRSELVELGVRELSWTRTALFIGASAVVAGILVAVAFNTSGGGGESGDGDVDNILIPLFQLSW